MRCHRKGKRGVESIGEERKDIDERADRGEQLVSAEAITK